jgi:hypothetical protein
LLALASAVILRSDSRGTHDHILLSQIRDSPNLEDQVLVFISPRKRVAQLYPQALGSLSSPPTAPRAKMEVFEPASTRGILKIPGLILVPKTSYLGWNNVYLETGNKPSLAYHPPTRCYETYIAKISSLNKLRLK